MASWKEHLELAETTMGTPLKLRNPTMDNLQQQGHNDKKRGPTTPLTPTLLQKNIAKKQYLHHTNGLVQGGNLANFIADERSRDNNVSDRYSLHETGSPKSKRSSSTPVNLRVLPTVENVTPNISAGIKQAVKEHKKSRLHMLRTEQADVSVSESEYSEMSTILGETPNYQLKDNLVYYKNGYYLKSVDDSFAELEISSIIDERELTRVNDLVEFMKIERIFENESS